MKTTLKKKAMRNSSGIVAEEGSERVLVPDTPTLEFWVKQSRCTSKLITACMKSDKLKPD